MIEYLNTRVKHNKSLTYSFNTHLKLRRCWKIRLTTMPYGCCSALEVTWSKFRYLSVCPHLWLQGCFNCLSHPHLCHFGCPAPSCYSSPPQQVLANIRLPGCLHSQLPSLIFHVLHPAIAVNTEASCHLHFGSTATMLSWALQLLWQMLSTHCSPACPSSTVPSCSAHEAAASASNYSFTQLLSLPVPHIDI